MTYSYMIMMKTNRTKTKNKEMSGFFVIQRTPYDSEETVSYFCGFENEFDNENLVECDGIEKWHEDDMYSFRFETYIEAKEWLKVIQKDTEHNAYEIVLMRFADNSDFEVRGDNCSGLIPLKRFYNTQEE